MPRNEKKIRELKIEYLNNRIRSLKRAIKNINVTLENDIDLMTSDEVNYMRHLTNEFTGRLHDTISKLIDMAE